MKIKYAVPAYTADWLICGVVPNPKRSGTECWLRYEAFVGADTVADFAKACGKGWRSELKWCVERGFVTLLDPATLEASGDEAEAEAAEGEAEAVAEVVPVEAAEAE